MKQVRTPYINDCQHFIFDGIHCLEGLTEEVRNALLLPGTRQVGFTGTIFLVLWYDMASNQTLNLPRSKLIHYH